MPRVVLTERLVLELQPEAGAIRTNYFDDHPAAPPGFCVRAGKRGAAYYVLGMNPADKARVWLKIGDVRAIGLKDARGAATKRLGELAGGVNPNASARQARAARVAAVRLERALTFAQLVGRYIDAGERDREDATNFEYRKLLRREIEGHPIAAGKADQLVRDDFRRWLDRIEERSPRTRDHVLSLARAAYRWGQIEEQAPGIPLVTRDPSFGLKFKVAGKRRTRHLSDEEIPVFWEGVATAGPIPAAYGRLLLLLAPRLSESAAGEWAHLDRDRAAWRIPTAVRKIRKTLKAITPDLEIPLPPLALRTFDELYVASGRSRFMFRGEGRVHLRGVNVHTISQQLKVASGIKAVTPHVLRRTCSAGLERLGAPPHIIGMVLGHSGTVGSSATDLHYILGRRPAEYRLWMERWAAHVARLVGAAESGVVAIRA